MIRRNRRGRNRNVSAAREPNGRVSRAVAQAAATRTARPSSPPLVVPPPWSERFDPTTYQRWILPVASGIAISDGRALITAPTPMHRDWLAGRLEADIRRCLGVREIEVAVSRTAEEAA